MSSYPWLPPLQTRPSYLPTDGKDVLAKFERLGELLVLQYAILDR